MTFAEQDGRPAPDDWRDARDGDGDVVSAALTATPSQPAVGETRLFRAVLLDAIDIYFKYAGATDVLGRRELAEVRRWFRSEDRGWPFAFVSVCEVLGLEPACVRRALRAARDARLASASPGPAGGAPIGPVDSSEGGPVVSRIAC